MTWARWILGVIAALMLRAAAVYLMLLPPFLAAAPRADFTLSQVTVFNPGQGRREEQTIVVKDGLIAQVRDARPDDPPPLCPGCVVMPGLSDGQIRRSFAAVRGSGGGSERPHALAFCERGRAHRHARGDRHRP